MPGEVRAAQPVLGAADMAALDDVRVLCLANRTGEAVRMIEPLVTRHPTSLEVWMLRAHILFSLKDLDGALASVERATLLDARDVDALKLMVKVLLAMKKEVRAVAMAERMLSLAPRDAQAHRLHADCLVAANRHADGVFAYEKVIQFVPSDAAAWLALGRTLRHLRRIPEARMALTRAQAIAEESDVRLAIEARELLAQLSGQ